MNVFIKSIEMYKRNVKVGRIMYERIVKEGRVENEIL